MYIVWFGEVEQCGVVVIRKGREFYDVLFVKVVGWSEKEDKDFDKVLKEVFVEYFDDWEVFRKEGLVYFCYWVVEDKVFVVGVCKLEGLVYMDRFLKEGVVICELIIYEDFLLFLVVGIFIFNFGGEKDGGIERKF